MTPRDIKDILWPLPYLYQPLGATKLSYFRAKYGTIEPKKLSVILLLGFSSGLPLALTGSTLQAWFTVSGVDIVTIGLMSLVGQPYAYKFLWAPLLDRFVPGSLGRRRGWMAITQIALVMLIASLGVFSPEANAGLIALVALFIAFMSATQDIAIDAYRADILSPNERGLGAALSVGGYRVAMLVSGGFALIMADHAGWVFTFVALAACMLIGLVATFWGAEPPHTEGAPTTLKAAVVEPFREFWGRKYALWLLAFLVLYKLGDAFAGMLTIAFLKRGVDFTLTEIGSVYKIVTLVSTLVGVFLGGVIMTRLSLWKSLFLFGLLQAITNLMFVWLAYVGKNFPIMVSAVTLENLAGGMGTAAFVAFLMSLCHHKYTATQFALFSALASVGRIFIAPIAGVVVDAVGWLEFFAWSALVGVPGLILLVALRRVIQDAVEDVEEKNNADQRRYTSNRVLEPQSE